MFSYDGPVYRFFKRIADVTILHVIWLLFSLPLITLGASTTALYGLSVKMRVGEEGDNKFLSYLDIFKRIWKRATLLFCAIILIFAVLISNLIYWNYVVHSAFGYFMSIICTALLIPAIIIAIYAPACMVIKDIGVVDSLKTALYSGYAHPFITIKLAFYWFWFIVINMTSLYVNVLCIFIGFGVFVHVFLSRSMIKIFDKEKAAYMM